ncbi:MAG: hydroxymethylglutaryl-CoA reductase, degradative [Alphaproteobacteria bacterium]|nr:hydroxymethylglutaryl-CoA reductase, degradative [Alphaproteobacteria bacterium]
MRSRIPGFYRLSPEDRLAALQEHGALDPEGAAVLAGPGLALDEAACMVENVVGTFALPNAAAVNLRINGEDRVVPMVVEEPSVVAAVSNMAQLTRRSGGITASSDASVMIGQVQLCGLDDPAAAAARLEAHTDALLAVARRVHPRLEARGGGVRGLRVRVLRYDEPGFTAEDMVVVELLLDCADAMGANMVNTAAEHLAPHVEAISGGRVGLRILSNLASHRLARARVRLDPAHLGSDEAAGAEVAEGIARAWRFAWADPWRAATHNKGVMNGIDAVAVATGNDWRAIEAGAHAWCAREGTYRPMTTWRVDEAGHLVGTLEVPLQFGTVGGASRIHPTARANLGMLGRRGARDLAAVAAAVGLVQNLGALRALATEGIQAGHMRMHARTVAVAAGAGPDEIAPVVEALCAASDFSEACAQAVLAELRA